MQLYWAEESIKQLKDLKLFFSSIHHKKVYENFVRKNIKFS